MNPTPPTVLVFAANDPSGGAGMMADVLALAALGCHCLPIITALTVQDTAGVQDFLATDAEFVNDQARCILEDVRIDAIKVGMVGSIENLAIIAEIASDYPDIPLILEPVFSAGRGNELTGDSMEGEELLSAMRELLLPHTHIVALSSSDARRLGSDDLDEREDLPLDVAAQRIIGCGCDYVLISGAHEKTPQIQNTLYSAIGRVRSDRWDRLPGGYHGAGATLAAALAGAMASGVELGTAVRDAQDYAWQTLSHAFRLGMGQMIPDRMFWARQTDENNPPGTVQ